MQFFTQKSYISAYHMLMLAVVRRRNAEPMESLITIAYCQRIKVWALPSCSMTHALLFEQFLQETSKGTYRIYCVSYTGYNLHT